MRFLADEVKGFDFWNEILDWYFGWYVEERKFK